MVYTGVILTEASRYAAVIHMPLNIDNCNARIHTVVSYAFITTLSSHIYTDIIFTHIDWVKSKHEIYSLTRVDKTLFTRS